MESAVLKIVAYEPSHQIWFEQLNRHWIEKYFSMEPIDFDVLQNPDEHILGTGGSIFMAKLGGDWVGTVAVKSVESGVYELTKMAVDEKAQGKKIGRALAGSAIDWVRSAGGKRIILFSNTKLRPAISLYRKLGFQEIPLDGPYKRSDIKMELNLMREVSREFLDA